MYTYTYYTDIHTGVVESFVKPSLWGAPRAAESWPPSFEKTLEYLWHKFMCVVWLCDFCRTPHTSCNMTHLSSGIVHLRRIEESVDKSNAHACNTTHVVLHVCNMTPTECDTSHSHVTWLIYTRHDSHVMSHDSLYMTHVYLPSRGVRRQPTYASCTWTSRSAAPFRLALGFRFACRILLASWSACPTPHAPAFSHTHTRTFDACITCITHTPSHTHILCIFVQHCLIVSMSDASRTCVYIKTQTQTHGHVDTQNLCKYTWCNMTA